MSLFHDGTDDPVQLSAHHPVQGRAVLEELELYWRDLRGARRLPVRSDVDPAQIDAALPHAFILERVAPGVGRMRVAGSALSGLLGMEARGMPLTTFFTPEARLVVTGYLERLFTEPALVELPLYSARSIGRPRLTGRLLMLPLLGNDGTVSRALGAMFTDGMIGRAPRRFDIPSGGAMRCEPLPEPAVRMAAVSSARPHMQRRPDVVRPALKLVVSNG